MINLDSVLKSKDVTLLTKVHMVKVMVFPVVTYSCEKKKKAQCQRIDSFKLWCWRRLLRVPWTARISNQVKSILMEINPEYSYVYVYISVSISVCVCVCVRSHVPLFATPWTVACQAPLSMGFSRQEYRNGLLYPSSGYLSDPEIEPTSWTAPLIAPRIFI